jgi:beta-lactamase class A
MLIYLVFFGIYVRGDAAMEPLKEHIQDLIQGQKTTYGIAFLDVTGNRHVFLNEQVEMHAASTMKVAVMLRLFEMIDEGTLSLEQTLRVHNSFTSIYDGSPFSVQDDSEKSLYRFTGRKVSLKRLIFLMITRSSNLATNILIERANPKNIQKLLLGLGIEHTRIRRGVEDLKAYEAGMNNTSTAEDLALMLLACLNSETFSAESHRNMIDILRAQKFNDMIPAGLPEGHQCLIAHKTGSISTVQHDAAIVQLPDGRNYILVIFSCNFQDERANVKQTMRKISLMVYESMLDEPGQ